MNDAALQCLLTWLSPSFPVGAFTYSHGLETAIEAGHVGDAASLHAWLDALLRHGAARNDAIFTAHALAGHDPCALDALARALQPARELREESARMGQAFVRAIAAGWPQFAPALRGHWTYPIAFGCAARAAGLAPRSALLGLVHGFIANQVSAAVRAVPLGQSDGLRVQAGLSCAIKRTVDGALTASLDDLGGSALAHEIAAMRHETQRVRLFRS